MVGNDLPIQESILKTIKKMLNIAPDVSVFDEEIIVFTNSSFMTLNQLGIGPKAGFSIHNDQTTWSDFTDSLELLSALQTYIYTFVKLLFDPPATSFGQEALRTVQKEQLWRLNVQTETERVSNEPK